MYASYFSIQFFATVLLTVLSLGNLRSQNCNSIPTFNQTFNNQTLTQAQTFSNQNIRITGTVNFNANVTMVRCTLLMDPGAVLNINNSTFTLTDNVNGRSVVFGCGNMWQAINVNAGSAVVFQNSNIRDGRLGLVFNQGFLNSSTRITGCQFSRNATCITATNVNNFTFATFSGNQFRGKVNGGDQFLPPFTPGSVLNGIRLNNCTGTIGTAGPINSILGMTAGIRMFNNSNVTLNNFTISLCFGADSENGGQGTGILSTASSLTIQNLFSNNASCSFSANQVGIRSQQTVALTVRNAAFKYAGVSDIEVINSTNPYSVNISNNTMDLQSPSGQSILLNRAAQTSGINTRIQSNIFNGPSNEYALNNSIRIINITSQAGATDQAIIADNQINCTYGNPTTGGATTTIDGIYITGNADGYQVSGNIINYPFANAPNTNITNVGIGMQTVGGINNIIGPNNTLTSNRFPSAPQLRDSWLRCGIHIQNSPNVAVCKNDIDDSRHDYHFMGNTTTNVEFGRNLIRDAIIGLIISDGCSVNNHHYRMNRWMPGSTYDNAGAIHRVPPQNLIWRVDATNGDPLGYIPPTFQPATWFSSVSNSQTSNTPVCDAVVPPSGGFGVPPTGEIAQDFLAGAYSDLGAPVAKWDFERNLLEQMIRFPATFAGNAKAEEYYTSEEYGKIWQFANAERMLHTASEIPPAQQQTLLQLHNTVQTLTDSLGKVERAEGIDSTSVIKDLQDQKEDILLQIGIRQTQIAALNAAIGSVRLNNLESVENYVTDLPQNSEFEKNYRMILLLMIKQQNGEAWTNADSASLRAIAYSCPAKGGEGVIIAREMLPTPEAYSFVREGDDPYCSAEVDQDILDRTHPEQVFAIWPNPARDLLNIDFGVVFTGTLEVSDMSGKTAYTIQVDGQQRQILHTSGLSEGVYFLRILTPDGTVQTQKITIIR